jgi:hypothetical protein
MKKFGSISAAALMFIFTSWLSAPAPARADRLEVLPTDFDFGDVEVGAIVTTIIGLMNINGHNITVSRVEFQAGGSADFYLPNPPSTPFDVVPGQTRGIEVAFTPSAAGYVSAVLEIESSDTMEPIQTIFFGGLGVCAQPPPVTIDDILSFFDASVEAGTIDGRGHRPAVKRARLKITRGMLLATSRFIDRGKIGIACIMLERAYKRCDGLLRPPDLIVGVHVPELATMIQELGACLGCGSSRPGLFKEMTLDNNAAAVPLDFSLQQNRPNPFNPTTAIGYSLGEAGHVKIAVYNMLGQHVALLINEFMPQGYHKVVWNASDQPSGFYIYRLQTREFTASKRMFLLK